jgi:hypothetical protein
MRLRAEGGWVWYAWGRQVFELYNGKVLV